jgi:thiol-disulfide isomerase/thioredoxin
MTQAPSRFNLRNLILAVTAIALSLAIFLGFQTQSHSVSLEAQAAQAIPMDRAVRNGKPTLTEFYANWCSSCQAMAPKIAQVKQKFGDSVNFVMLNVDNNKWLPEVLRYRVDGIPHFVFLDRKGEAIAQTLGEQPLGIMEANLNALVDGAPLPFATATGQTSELVTPKLSPSDPRSHSAQVKS